MDDVIIPNGFLRLSDAVSLLAQGIWGGLRRPIPVRKLKRKYKKASVGFGRWREEAGKLLTTAVVRGKVALYMFGNPQAEIGRPGPELKLVQPAAAGRLIATRGVSQIIRELR
jgi:hypothetical protein